MIIVVFNQFEKAKDCISVRCYEDMSALALSRNTGSPTPVQELQGVCTQNVNAQGGFRFWRHFLIP